jgi:hypothetical protein
MRAHPLLERLAPGGRTMCWLATRHWRSVPTSGTRARLVAPHAPRAASKPLLPAATRALPKKATTGSASVQFADPVVSVQVARAARPFGLCAAVRDACVLRCDASRWGRSD